MSQFANGCCSCGGELLGDGVTEVLKCEFAEEESGREGDSGVVECDFAEEQKRLAEKQHRWFEEFNKKLTGESAEPLDVEETMTNQNADLGYEGF